MEQQKDSEITLKLPMSKINIIVDALAARTFASENLMNEVINQGNAQLENPIAGWKARQAMAGFDVGDLVEEKTDTLGINEPFEDELFAILGKEEEVKYAWGEGVIQVTVPEVTQEQLKEIEELVNGSVIHCVVEPSSKGTLLTFELMEADENTENGTESKFQKRLREMKERREAVQAENSGGVGLGTDWNEKLLGLFSDLDQMKEVDFDFSEAGKVEVLCQLDRHIVAIQQIEDKAILLLDGTEIDGEAKELPEGKTLFTFTRQETPKPETTNSSISM